MGLRSALAEFFRPGRAAAGQPGAPGAGERAIPRADAGYQGASRTHQDLASWLPRAFSAQSALSPDRNLLTSRIHDLARNDGWASAGLDRLVDNVIGGGWGLNALLNRRRLKLDDAAATDIAAQIEAEFEDWATDPDCWCDAEMRNGFGGLLALAYRHRAMDGEALAVISFDERGGPWATAIQVVDPDRLSQPQAAPETDRFRQGIELGPSTEPLAYHIRRAHPGEAFTWRDAEHLRVPRFMGGRRLVVHAFEPTRAGQIRGVPALASVVKKLRMLGRYDEAELQAAVINAVLAAFVTTPYDPDAMAEAMAGGSKTEDILDAMSAAREKHWAEAPPMTLPGAAINFLAPGEEIKLSNPHHPNSVFESFTRASLRNIASALGITYEQLSADWGQVNYSSARAALLEVWRGFTARAGHFAHQFVQPIYVRWFEEAVARRRIVLPRTSPSFEEARAAWTRARWRMPGRGWVDPLKEAQAADLRVRLGISTLEREAAEQGLDWEENLEQRARELKRVRELEASYGLPEGALLNPAAVPASAGGPDEQNEDVRNGL
ncbi:phage portal protein [Xanthobacter tagetidis]|uniref:Phage portal protein n=1 Tax=Xanthobacter tagetidis TaxID=60216 RepID=A0A3L7ALH4_9HYPH|nr:phage portal protein [Xanthobacter tagetidis]MBB6308918.1 lambda family phage portal protein [Xanthobacter tagetidis]RLP80570.1 phage portal protein [Xanthobacter tagetidis]